MIDTYGREVGITFSPILELSTMESMLQKVQLNIGATILPKSYLNVNHILDHRIKMRFQLLKLFSKMWWELCIEMKLL